MLYTAPFLHFNHVLDAVFLLLQIDPSMIEMSRVGHILWKYVPPDRSFGRPEYHLLNPLKQSGRQRSWASHRSE